MDGILQKYNFLVNQGKIMLPRACQKLLAVVQQEVTDGQATWIISKNTWRWLVCPAGSLPGQYKHMITSILKKKKLLKLGSQWGTSHSNNNRHFLLNTSNTMASEKTFSRSIFSPKDVPSGSGGGCRWWYHLMTTAWLGKSGGLEIRLPYPTP